MKALICVFVAILQSVSSLAFTGRPIAIQSRVAGRSLESKSKLSMALSDLHLDRRSLLSTLPAVAAFSLQLPALAADAKSKVVVVGGSGWVGAHVAQILLDKGYVVYSVSRSSPSNQAEKVKAILGKSLQVSYESLDASKDDLSGVFSGATAVISCVGATPGSKNQRDGNGAVNVRIADAAKAAGIEKFVYLSVATEVASGPAKFLFGDYFKGKAEAEAAVKKDYGSSALVIKPGIIAGAPPGEMRPPGPPGMAAISAEAVAKAAVAGAIGNLQGTIDGNAAIENAAAAAAA